MKNKIKNITFIILGIFITYSALAITLKSYFSKKYDIELNEKRIEIGLLPITNDWKLDSIVLQPPIGNISCFPSEVLETTDYGLLENKWYCQYWSNKKIDTSKPYHNSKTIYYTTSFWIWQNTIDLEFNTYINPNSELVDYEVLESSTDWYSNGETYGYLKHMKNGNDLLIDNGINEPISGFDNQKVDAILRKWNIK